MNRNFSWRAATLCALRILGWAVFAGLAVWGAGVVYYCLGLSWWGLALYLAALGVCARFRQGMWAVYAACGLVAALELVYLCIPASNDRDWQAPWSKMAEATVDGDTLVIKNVRDFRYRTEEDYDVRYVTKTYSLDKLDTLDFIVSHWDGIELVSHTLLSFGFSDGQHLALSAETRLDKGDEQGAVPGLFKRFELQFIFATEEDIFALRTNYRHEDLYLYRVAGQDPKQLRKVLLAFVAKANELRECPKFYNTVTNNCTTALRGPLQQGFQMPASRMNAGSILNGYIDRKAFDKGWLMHKPEESFEELRRRSLVPHDISKNNPADYSKKIREAVFSK